MCDHRAYYTFKKADPPSSFRNRDHCNIYYLHRDGHVKRHENIPFRDPVIGLDVASSFCGDDRLTLMSDLPLNCL